MFQSFSASVIGSAHISRKIPCHDSHQVKLLDDGQSIICAVSDGMGSALHAEIGSQIAVESIVEYIMDAYLEDKEIDVCQTIKDGYYLVQKNLENEALEQDFNVKDLNCTLLVFVAIKGDDQYIGQVGDCIAIGKSGDEPYQLFVNPQKGEYANQTFSIVNTESIDNGEYFKLEKPLTDIALMSDGLEKMTIDLATLNVSKGFFDPFFNAFSQPHFETEKASKSLQAFLSSERINKKTDDDKTLVFIHQSS